MRFTQAIAKHLEGTAEQVRRNLVLMIRELQSIRITQGKLIANVELADATDTPIQHGLGRPALIFVSPVRGSSTSGRIEETRDIANFDRNSTTVLQANGFGATVTVDVWIF